MTQAGSQPTLRQRASLVWRMGWSLIIGGIIAAAATVLLAAPFGESPDAVSLAVGDVTATDIIAPRSITYISQIQTESARAAAAALVPDVYDPPDSRVARQQIARARQTLDYVSSVRADAFGTPEQKNDDLIAIIDFQIDPNTALALLSLKDAEWSAVQTEVISVIQRSLSAQVREDRIEDARNRLPALVSVSLPESQAALVTTLATPYLAPNSFYNDAATQAARQAAREAVEPIAQTFVQGQTVISRGKVVTEADLEALSALGLLQPTSRWQIMLSGGLSVLLAALIVYLYARQFNRAMLGSPRLMVYLGTVFILFLLAARLMIPGRTVLPFLLPSAALAMLVAVTLGANMGIIISVVFAMLAGVISNGRLDVTVYLAFSGIVATLTLGKAERVNSFFWAGLSAAVANAGIVLIFRLNDPGTDALGIATLLAASLVNGITAAAVTLSGFFVLGYIFDITTSLQLVELARPNHPLLQYMLRQAPGTYQHCLQVANLAEQAAERIGANTMLIRVGALFHDVGKSSRPEYFVENQLDGVNPHHQLSPEMSSRYIVDHVIDGLKMAARHRLPGAIRACIAEHHGTMITRYQFQQAIEAAGGDESLIDKSHFQYPGPKPQSKETALLMLADGCEAKTRSDRPHSVEEIEKIVNYIVDTRLAAGQLDECDITLHDLKLVRESFVDTLRSFFHSRLQYPEEKIPAITTPGTEDKR